MGLRFAGFGTGATLVGFGLLVAVSACMPAADGGEDLSTSTSNVTRGSCAEVGAKDEFAKVTADTSGVKCYDESGTYVASVAGSMNGTESLARVVPGTKKTFDDKTGNFVRVKATDAKGNDLDCWMSTDYLCATARPAAERAGTETVENVAPPPAPPPAAPPPVVGPPIKPIRRVAGECYMAHRQDVAGAQACCDSVLSAEEHRAPCRNAVADLAARD